MSGAGSGAGMAGAPGMDAAVRPEGRPGMDARRESWFVRHIRRRIDAVSLGSKLDRKSVV